MQTVGKTCPLCEERIMAAKEGTWCAKCETAYHVQCLILAESNCPQCKSQYVPPGRDKLTESRGGGCDLPDDHLSENDRFVRTLLGRTDWRSVLLSALAFVAPGWLVFARWGEPLRTLLLEGAAVGIMFGLMGLALAGVSILAAPPGKRQRTLKWAKPTVAVSGAAVVLWLVTLLVAL
jgi:hypothetical protein